MADKGQELQPTQRTEKGVEIPVPERKDVLDVFEKAAKGSDPSRPKQ